MKSIITIFLFLISSIHSYACLYATKNRIFPLGHTPKGLCVVEVHLTRIEFFQQNGETVELKPGWRGISYLKIYDNNYIENFSEALDTIETFDQNFHDSIIGVVYDKGKKAAEKMPDFIPAKHSRTENCLYNQKCKLAKIEFDTFKNKVFIHTNTPTRHVVKPIFLQNSVANNVVKFYTNQFNADISSKLLIGKLHLGSYRLYQIGSKKLTIVHISSNEANDAGESVKYFTYRKRNEEKVNILSSDSIYLEPTLAHTHGFDFFILE